VPVFLPSTHEASGVGSKQEGRAAAAGTLLGRMPGKDCSNDWHTEAFSNAEKEKKGPAFHCRRTRLQRKKRGALICCKKKKNKRDNLSSRGRPKARHGKAFGRGSQHTWGKSNGRSGRAQGGEGMTDPSTRARKDFDGRSVTRAEKGASSRGADDPQVSRDRHVLLRGIV